MKINERIKLIRITEGFTQSDFADLIGVVSDRSVRMIENGKSEVGSAKIERICKRFPEYTLWLMTGKTQPPHQIDPYIRTSKSDKTA